MIIILCLLALPLGFPVRDRMAAYLIYAVAFGHVYTFQTATLVMEWTDGATAAFPAGRAQQLLGGALDYLCVHHGDLCGRIQAGGPRPLAA